MGIIFTTNTLGISNINLFGAHKIGNDQIHTLAGLFANINLDGGPFVSGFFGETNIAGHGISFSFAGIESLGKNIQAGLRLRLFHDEYIKTDFNLIHNSTNLFEGVKFARYGGNICWSFSDGLLMSIGATHTPLLKTTTLDLICKANLWKSETEIFNIDFTTNIIFYLHGPLSGFHNFVASLTVSYNLFSNKKEFLEKKPQLESLTN